MHTFIQAHRTALGSLGAIFALIIATVYLFAAPTEADGAQGAARYILLYGHSLCWMLLAAASAGWAMRAPFRLLAIIAYAALASYVLFMATLLITKNVIF